MDRLGWRWARLLRGVLPANSNRKLDIHEGGPTVADPVEADGRATEIGSSARDSQAAARSLGLQLHVLHASTDRDLDTAFATLGRLQAGALVIGSDPFFTSRSQQLAALTVRHAVPAVYEYRDFVAAGGLAGYGSHLADAYRLAGVYAGRILKGTKPANLPVQQSIKVELVINLKTAKALGVTIPLPLVGRADEVIE